MSTDIGTPFSHFRHLLSRNGKPFDAPDWFIANLPSDMTLDGELWMGRKKFQEAVGIVKSKASNDKWKQMSYVIFDTPSHGKEPVYKILECLSHFSLKKG